MRVLFLTIGSVADPSSHSIYADLMREFRDRGDEVFIACASERRYGEPTSISIEDGMNVLRVRTGNVTKCAAWEKGISTVLIEGQFRAAIQTHLGSVRFDIVLYSTPPITFARVVRYVKRRDSCVAYLMLKDIFPQNAVDLGMMRKGSLIWRYFRTKEIELYEISDHIGCMSPANVRYLLTHEPWLTPEKLEVCPNSIKPFELPQGPRHSGPTRTKYGIPTEAVVFAFGGNLGRPQGVEFFLAVLDVFKDSKTAFFLIAGSGTESERISRHLDSGHHSNVRFIGHLPANEYQELLAACDVGMVFLDSRFTIPNFPSRFLSYLELAMPVIAATDPVTDLRTVVQESGCGYWARSDDVPAVTEAILEISRDPELRRAMGIRGRSYLEAHYTVAASYETILQHVPNR